MQKGTEPDSCGDEAVDENRPHRHSAGADPDQQSPRKACSSSDSDEELGPGIASGGADAIDRARQLVAEAATEVGTPSYNS